MQIRTTLQAGAVAALVALVTTGCLADSASEGNTNTDSSIEIMYGFTDAGSDKFQAALADFLEAEDIDVTFSPTPDFNSLVNSRVQGNDLPDIAIFPQPGIMASIARTGVLADLGEVLDAEDVEANFVGGALDAGKVDGTQYAVPMGINIKSIVFYPKQAFEAAGFQEPTTQDELFALADEIKATGTAPWCFGIESGAATGWPATDWIENLVLINGGTQTYNDWVAHEIPFNDPIVAESTDQMARLLLTEGNTQGGQASIASSNFATSANPMFDAVPGCYLHRQGNFLAQDGGFPATVLADLDSTVGVFAMPGLEADSKPVLGGGDLAALFSKDNESAQKVMQFLTSTEFGAHLAPEGGYISPRTDFDLSLYPNETTKRVAQIAYDSTEFVFDGSDQMPGAVGSGSFWREMTAWISGQTTQQDALDAIEASWPAS